MVGRVEGRIYKGVRGGSDSEGSKDMKWWCGYKTRICKYLFGCGGFNIIFVGCGWKVGKGRGMGHGWW